MLTVVVALIYNMFFHQLANTFYKELPVEQKYANSVIMLAIIGIVGLVINIKYASGLTSKEVSRGINLGSFLLLLSATINGWNVMNDLTRLVAIAAILGLLIKYGSDKKITKLPPFEKMIIV